MIAADFLGDPTGYRIGHLMVPAAASVLMLARSRVKRCCRAMDQHPSASPEQARKFAPKDQPRADSTDEAGRALIAMLEQAVSLANENYKGPTELANKIVRELRAAEERIKEFEAGAIHARLASGLCGPPVPRPVLPR